MDKTPRDTSPEDRLVELAHEIVLRRGGGCPQVQKCANFCEELRLLILREILKTRLEVMQRHGTYPEAMALQKEIEQVNAEILRREAPP